MNEAKNLRLRIYLVWTVLVLFGGAIAVKLFIIQLAEGDKWRAQAVNVATAMRTVQPDRGHIYSDDDRLLATSVPEYEVRMDMRVDGLTSELFNANVDSLSIALAGLFGDRSSPEYRRSLIDARAQGARFFLIKRKCDHEQLQSLQKLPLFRLGRYKSGLIVSKSLVRMNPFGRLARRTVGYVLKDSTAIGLEGGYGKWLGGITGLRLERRLTGGVWMPIDDGEGQDPVPGNDIHTTLDINLQDVADAALEAQLRKNGAHHGCVVVMETQTGYIKAISNLTLQKDSTYAEDLNYAVGASTEPGSTFKTAALMVGLEDGVITPDQVVDTRGGKRKFFDRWMYDSHEGGYGLITLQHALEVSSNTGISQAIDAGYRKDPKRFVEGLRKLGFGSPLGIRIPGEGMPTLRGPEDKKFWSGVSLPWMSIGYEVSVTPMRILAFYNAIANKGRLMQPQFVRSITHEGKVVERFEPVALNEQICSQATLGKIQHMLEGVVDTGTAINLKSAHFRIAGKTGTAQIASDKAGYKVNGVSYQASFVGYFPAEAPRYTCIVVVSSPSMRGIYGNVVAGPVFREIADKIYSNRLEMQTEVAQVKTTERTPVTMSGHASDLATALTALGIRNELSGEGEWVSTEAADSLVRMKPRNIPDDAVGMVPNVLGMGLKDALYILENRGLKVRVVGSGMVKKQSLQPGSRCFKEITHRTRAHHMKLLKDLLYKARLEQVVGSTNTAIEHLTFDSRAVVPFTAFVAVKGTKSDGHDFIRKAVELGATAIICEVMPETQKEGVAYVRVADSQHALAVMACNFYEDPSKELKLVGVTGTNGKTSIATLLYRLYRTLGHKCGLISTVEIRIGNKVVPSTHTTPDAVRLNELLAQMVAEKVTHCFMEVSSHSVVQERITGLHFVGGVFTNITHDHLDYHGTFAEYIKAKKRFFDQLPAGSFSLVNADDPNSAVMLQNTRASKHSYAVRNMADHKARIIENQLTGLHLNIDGHDLYARLIGEFNASNLLAVYTTAILLGEQPMDVLTTISDLEPPTGRFQVVRGASGVIGIVDYAHTPDALKNVLSTIAAVCDREEKVITVVGCGGDRDRTKRPIMAQIAVAMSHTVVLTSDNPRSEDPMAILDEMRKGISPAEMQRVFVNADRREAIRQAVGLTKPGDVVLVAGKGHETYQEINGVKHPFDDAAILRETLELMHK